MAKFERKQELTPTLGDEQRDYITLINSKGWAKLAEFMVNWEEELIEQLDNPKFKRNIIVGQLQAVRFLRKLPEKLAASTALVQTEEEKEAEIVRSTLGIPDSVTGII